MLWETLAEKADQLIHEGADHIVLAAHDHLLGTQDVFGQFCAVVFFNIVVQLVILIDHLPEGDAIDLIEFSGVRLNADVERLVRIL